MTRTMRVAKAGALVEAVLLLWASHFAIGTQTHTLHDIHLVLGGLSLLPILAGAVWFGVRGGVLTAALVSALFFGYMRVSWPNRPMENENQTAMIFVYMFVGTASGILVMLQNREHNRRLAAERNAEREAIIQGLTCLSTALGSRDGYALEHSCNVSRLAVELGRRRGLGTKRLELLRLSALVHDIGKIGIRDDILFKRDRLTSEEKAEVHRHPEIAADILRAIHGTEAIAEIVLSHHEKLNGTGYPRGLHGQQIPLEAQILSVADIFCALTERRPYKPAIMDAEKAMRIIEPMADVELDAVSVDLLRSLVMEMVSQRSMAVGEEENDLSSLAVV